MKKTILNRRTQAEVVVIELDEIRALMLDRQDKVKKMADSLVAIGQHEIAQTLINQKEAFSVCIGFINNRINHIKAGAPV